MGIGFGENEGQGFGGDVGNSNGPGDNGWGTGTGETSNNAAGYQNLGDMAGAWGKNQAESPDNMGPFDVAIDRTITPENDFFSRAKKGLTDYIANYKQVPKGVTIAAGMLVPGTGIAFAAGGIMAAVMAGMGATPASPEQVAANEQADIGRATNGPNGEMPGILNTNPSIVNIPTVNTPVVDIPKVDPAQYNSNRMTSYKGKSYV